MNSTDYMVHKNKYILIETLIVLLITVLPSLFFPALKGMAVFFPILYLIIEGWLRKRSWKELGLQTKVFLPALVKNWWLVLLVSIIIQATVIFAAKLWLPEFITHVAARLPFTLTDNLIPVIISLLIATFAEELVYRGLFQQRFSWFMPSWMAILGISVLFAVLHWAAGAWLIIFIDVFLVFVDSVLYGLIFARGKSLLLAWLAHFLADVVALVLMLTLVR